MGSLLKILTDLDCELWIDQEFSGKIVKGLIYKKKLNEGNYIIELKIEGKTLKFFNIELSNEQELLLKARLTRKVNITIIDKLLTFPEGWAVEGDFIDRHKLETLISIDGINWERNKLSYVFPLNYDGLQVKFNYGYENFGLEDKDVREIKHSYQCQIFWQYFNNYKFYQTPPINEAYTSSLDPFDFNQLAEYKEDNINIEINISWLNIQEINTLFYRVNNNWHIKRFGDGLKKYNSFSINPEVTKIKGIEPPYLLVSNGEKDNVINMDTNNYVLPFKYDKVYNEGLIQGDIYKYFYNIHFNQGFKIELNSKVGFSDNMGKIIIPPLYKNVFKTKIGYILENFNTTQSFSVLDNNESYDEIYSIIYNHNYDNIEKVLPNSGLIIFYKNGDKIGWWDKEGVKSSIIAEEVQLTKHKLSFYRFSFYSEDEIFYVKKDGKWGLFSYLQGQLVPFDYDEPFEYEFDTETLIYINEIDKVRKGHKYKAFCVEMLDQILFFENGGYSVPDLNQIPKSCEKDLEELNYDILLQKAVKFNLLDPIIKIKGKIDGVITTKEFSLL